MKRPSFAAGDEYAARLGDRAFWAPYVHAALARHGLPAGALEVGTVGSFPTFLVGRYVVKLFGELVYGPECHAAERSALRLLREHPAVPAPTLIADGDLFAGDDHVAAGWPWPYLILTRLDGAAWADARPATDVALSVAAELGRAMRTVHELPVPHGATWERDWLAELYATCAARQRIWGTLPVHLVEQIDGYLIAPSGARRLVHADLHDHHILIEDGQLAGILDWGDAIAVDRHYDLPALHLLTFKGDTRLLRSFLESYGWDIDRDFPRRAMSMALAHEFNPLAGLRSTVEYGAAASLEELAAMLWELS